MSCKAFNKIKKNTTWTVGRSQINSRMNVSEKSCGDVKYLAKNPKSLELTDFRVSLSLCKFLFAHFKPHFSAICCSNCVTCISYCGTPKGQYFVLLKMWFPHPHPPLHAFYHFFLKTPIYIFRNTVPTSSCNVYYSLKKNTPRPCPSMSISEVKKPLLLIINNY